MSKSGSTKRERLACALSGREHARRDLVSLELVHPGLAERITERVAAQSLAPKHMVLEITETAAMTDVAKALENLTRLRMKGFGLSIDDYGTGYSSMQQLSRVPFTELKIDGSVMRSAGSEAIARRFLDTAVAIAHELDLEVVAEGVETEMQLHLAAEHGVDVIQGFLFSVPSPARDIKRPLEQSRALAFSA